MKQKEFNQTIGKLDRILSKMMRLSKKALDLENRQTLKHHAEDMIAAGEAILKKLHHTEGTPQPKKYSKAWEGAPESALPRIGEGVDEIVQPKLDNLAHGDH